MTSRHLTALAALAALALAPAASAQEVAPALPDDPRAPRFREIERGLFVAAEIGFLGLTKTPTSDRTKYKAAGEGGGFAAGPVVGLQLGFDLGDRLSLALVALGANQQASISYGAFSLIGAGADARVALWGMKDSQGTERLFLYAHARGAWFATDPRGLFGDTDILVAAGPGLEYHTRLRHFALGLAIDGVYALQAKSPGIAVVPTLRYTF